MLTTYVSGDGAAAGEFTVLVLKLDPNAQSATPAAAGGHSANAVPDGSKMHAAEVKKKVDGGSGGGIPAKYGRVAESTLNAKVEVGGKNEFPFDLAP